MCYKGIANNFVKMTFSGNFFCNKIKLSFGLKTYFKDILLWLIQKFSKCICSVDLLLSSALFPDSWTPYLKTCVLSANKSRPYWDVKTFSDETWFSFPIVYKMNFSIKSIFNCFIFHSHFSVNVLLIFLFANHLSFYCWA